MMHRMLIYLFVFGIVSTTGCLYQDTTPPGVVAIKASATEGSTLREFVVVREVRREPLHSIEDPPKDRWLPPELASIALSENGVARLRESAVTTSEGAMIAPFLGTNRSAEVDYRVFARGCEVLKSRYSYQRFTWKEDRGTLVPTMANMRRVHRNVNGEPSDWFDIIRDLQDDAWWTQLGRYSESSRVRAAAVAICEYYNERINEIESARPNATGSVGGNVSRQLIDSLMKK